MGHERVMVWGVVGLLLGCVGAARGQAIVDGGGPTSYPAPEWMERLLPDPESPYWEAYAAQEQQRRETERELEQFRRTYFGHGLGTETRQVGMSLLRERYNRAELYPLLLEVFEHDDEARMGLVEMFAETESEEAGAALAWEAVHDDEAALREAALDLLVSRVEREGEVSNRVRLVVASGLQTEDDSAVIAASGIAEVLSLYEMVPLMIAAQVGGGGQGGAGEGSGPLGWIVVAQQQAFVSDLQPVVSNSAVGFDPTLSVVTEGVVLEVNDAVVITYRTEVFYSLTRMTSEALGRPTGAWGMDEGRWWEWYESDWKPWMVERVEG